jgi:hypothetical protein
MTVHTVSAPYEGTVGRIVRMLRSNSGTEASDPSKVAQGVLQVADLPEPPVKQLLGIEAV